MRTSTRQWKLSLRRFHFLISLSFFSCSSNSVSTYAGSWLSLCVCVCVRVSHPVCISAPVHVRVPCAAELIHLCQTDKRIRVLSVRISKAKQATVENIISHTHTHTYNHIHAHILTQNRHILFVLSYQYRHSTKQGQMQLFAQSTAMPTPTLTTTANSAFAKKERKNKQQNELARRAVMLWR